MPRGDKTGPEGLGSMTGRRMGFCVGNKQAGFNFDRVSGRGLARGFRGGQGRRGYFNSNQKTFFREDSENSNQSNKKIIENEINILKKQLEYLENELKNCN